MVREPTVPVNNDKFLGIWNTVCSLFMSFKSVINEIDFICFPSKLDEIFRIAIQLGGNDERLSQIISVACESLESLKQQLIMLSQRHDITCQNIRNAKVALLRFMDDFENLKLTIFKIKMIRHSEISQKMQYFSQLNFLLDFSLSAFSLQEMVTNIQLYIKESEFLIGPADFVKDGALYSFTCQASDLLIQLLRSLSSIGVHDYNIQKLQQISKNFSDSLKLHTFDSESIKEMTKIAYEIRPIGLDKKEKNTIEMCERAVGYYFVAGKNPTPEMVQAKNWLNNFKKHSNAPNGVDSISDRFWTFMFFAECYTQSHVPDDPYYDEIKTIIMEFKNALLVQIFIYHIHEITQMISKAFPDISKTSMSDMIAETSEQYQGKLDELLSMLAGWMPNQHFTDYDVSFMKLLDMFLRLCKLISKTNEEKNYEDVIIMMLSIFPNPDQIKNALKLNDCLINSQKHVNKLSQGHVNDLASMKETSSRYKNQIGKDSFQHHIFINTKSYKNINYLIEILVDVSFRIKFSLLYESFCESNCQGRELFQNWRKEKIDNELLSRSLTFLGSLISIAISPSIYIDPSPDFLMHLLEIINCLFSNNDDKAKEYIMKVIHIVPHVDFSRSLAKSLFNIRFAELEIGLYQLTHPNSEESVSEILRLYRIATDAVLTSLVSGNIGDMFSTTQKLIFSISMLDINLSNRVRPLWEDVFFLGGHMVAISDLVGSADRAMSDDKPIQEANHERKIALVLHSFIINFFSAFAIHVQKMAENGFVLESSSIDLTNCISTMAYERNNAFQEITLKNVDDLVYYYFIVRDQLHFSPLDLILSRISPIIDYLSSLLSINEMRLIDRANELILKMYRSIVEVKQKTDSYDQSLVILYIKCLADDMRKITGSKEFINQCLDELSDEIDNIIFAINVQTNAFVGDIILARLCGTFRKYNPEFNMSPVLPLDQAGFEPDDFPPVPPFRSFIPKARTQLNGLIKIAGNDQNLISLVQKLNEDINSSYKVSAETSLICSSAIKEKIEKSQTYFKEGKLLREQLTKELHKLQEVVKENQKQIQEENEAYHNIESLVNQNARISYELENKSKQCDMELLDIKSKSAEYHRQFQKYNDIKDKINTSESDTFKETPQKAPHKIKVSNDPSLLEISQQLSDLISENEKLRKELNETRVKNGIVHSEKLIREEIHNLENRNKELLAELDEINLESITKKENIAKENDEILFDLFDQIRSPLTVNKSFSQKVIDNSEKLLYNLIYSIEAQQERLYDVKKFIAMKKSPQH